SVTEPPTRDSPTFPTRRSSDLPDIFNEHILLSYISNPDDIRTEIDIRKHYPPSYVTLRAINITLIRLLKKRCARADDRITCFFIYNNNLYRSLLRQKK